jgi:hypothetical protein
MQTSFKLQTTFQRVQNLLFMCNAKLQTLPSRFQLKITIFKSKSLARIVVKKVYRTL